jgi:hypothetical protein
MVIADSRPTVALPAALFAASAGWNIHFRTFQYSRGFASVLCLKKDQRQRQGKSTPQQLLGRPDDDFAAQGRGQRFTGWSWSMRSRFIAGSSTSECK